MTPVDLCRKQEPALVNGLLLYELAQQAEGSTGHGRTILSYGIDAQRQTIKQVVIIKAAEVNIGSHQLVLIQIA